MLPQNLILNSDTFLCLYINFWKYILYLGILWQKQKTEMQNEAIADA